MLRVTADQVSEREQGRKLNRLRMACHFILSTSAPFSSN